VHTQAAVHAVDKDSVEGHTLVEGHNLVEGGVLVEEHMLEGVDHSPQGPGSRTSNVLQS